MESCKLSLVIPCYNEEKNVPLFYNEILKTFKNNKLDVELVFINDGSSDNTLKELEKLLVNKKFEIKIIDFSRNFGKEAGIYAGLQNATGDFVAIIDADLQQPPKLILDMLKILKNNPSYDAVAAYQVKRTGNYIKRFLNKTFYKLINKVSEIKIKNDASDFRLLRRNVVNTIITLKEYNRFSKGIFSWIGFKTYYIEYKAQKRANGKSKWPFKKLFRYAFDGILSYTTLPLKITTFTGTILTITSFGYLIFNAIQKIFFHSQLPEYTFILSCILIIGSIEILFLGIIGEYIARIYIETKERPIYIAKNIMTNKNIKK